MLPSRWGVAGRPEQAEDKQDELTGSGTEHRTWPHQPRITTYPPPHGHLGFTGRHDQVRFGRSGPAWTAGRPHRQCRALARRRCRVCSLAGGLSPPRASRCGVNLRGAEFSARGAPAASGAVRGRTSLDKDKNGHFVTGFYFGCLRTLPFCSPHGTRPGCPRAAGDPGSTARPAGSTRPSHARPTDRRGARQAVPGRGLSGSHLEEEVGMSRAGLWRDRQQPSRLSSRQ